MLKKTVLMPVLTLALLFVTAQGLQAAIGANKAWLAVADQYFETAMVYIDRAEAAGANPNLDNAELFLSYAEYYATYASRTGDRNAALAAYTYGYYAAIYAGNASAGNADAFTAFQFAWYGSYYALIGAGRR